MCENLNELQDHNNASHKKTKKKRITPKVVCDICGLDVDQDYLKIHLAIKHDIKSTSLKMVQCHICSKQIISKTSMKRHLRTAHKSYEKCKICGKEVSISISIKVCCLSVPLLKWLVFL